MKVKDMSLQLETATISNTLLRDELNALQHDKQSMYKKVTITDSKLKEYEEEKKRLQEEISRRVYQAKVCYWLINYYCHLLRVSFPKIE